jgi:hypothetical protein
MITAHTILHKNDNSKDDYTTYISNLFGKHFDIKKKPKIPLSKMSENTPIAKKSRKRSKQSH